VSSKYEGRDEMCPVSMEWEGGEGGGFRRGPVHLQWLQAGAGSWQAGVPRAFGPARWSLSFARSPSCDCSPRRGFAGG
jgi:hypothetical protein